MGTYSTSSGERLTRSQIETRIRNSKRELLENQILEHGYNFCEDCGRNASGTRIDCSHNISVKKCLEEGMAEIAWDKYNMKVLCRECHQKKDRLNVQWTKL